MYVMCVVLWSASVGWYVDCKYTHGMKNTKHGGMQLGCQSSIQEVADSKCGHCSTHITILFRKLSFNSPFLYVRIQHAAQQTPILCSQLLCFPRLYALFVWSQIMHGTTMYISLHFTHLTVFPLHFPSLTYRIYLILHLIFLFSDPPPIQHQQGRASDTSVQSAQTECWGS